MANKLKIVILSFLLCNTIQPFEWQNITQTLFQNRWLILAGIGCALNPLIFYKWGKSTNSQLIHYIGENKKLAATVASQEKNINKLMSENNTYKSTYNQHILEKEQQQNLIATQTKEVSTLKQEISILKQQNETNNQWIAVYKKHDQQRSKACTEFEKIIDACRTDLGKLKTSQHQLKYENKLLLSYFLQIIKLAHPKASKVRIKNNQLQYAIQDFENIDLHSKNPIKANEAWKTIEIDEIKSFFKWAGATDNWVAEAQMQLTYYENLILMAKTTIDQFNIHFSTPKQRKRENFLNLFCRIFNNFSYNNQTINYGWVELYTILPNEGNTL